MSEQSPIQRIVKAELHRHLELCVRPQTIWDLAPAAGIKLGSQAEFQERFMILEPMKDLGSVLNKFLDTQKLLRTPEILERVAFEAAEDCFVKENARVVEFRYAPTFVALGNQMSFDQIHEAFVRGFKRAEEKYAMAIGIVCIIQRILPVSEGARVTDFAIANRDTICGLDIADNEEGFDSKPFAPHFKRAAASGLGITIHSGEAPHPKAPSWVMDAIEVLGAQRIGHGVQIYRDPAVMKVVADRKIPLELCPTSNWLTNAVPDLKAHPLRMLFEAGVRTTINTDDPVIFNTDLNREYRVARDEMGLSLDQLETCAQTAAETSFIPRERRAKVWPRALNS